MASQPREHRDLPAMVSIMCDQIPQEAPHVRLKTLDPPVSGERIAQTTVQRFETRFQSADGFLLSELAALQFLRNLRRFPRALQPHQTHIVHMCRNGGNIATFPAWRPATLRRADSESGKC